MPQKLLVRRVAVLGAGVMGAQIAAYLVNAGVDTVLFDLPARKFYLFGAAIEAGYVWLALLAVVNSAISAFYYLGLVRAMYMKDPLTADQHQGVVLPAPARLAVGLGVVLLLVLGILPRLVIGGSDRSAASFAGSVLDRAVDARR